MEFGIVTDELSQDLREAIEAALEWGVRKFRTAQCPRYPVPPV